MKVYLFISVLLFSVLFLQAQDSLNLKISIGNKHHENPVNHSFLMKIGGQHFAKCSIEKSRLKSEKSFSLSQGFVHTVNKDLYRSPYVYKGFNPTVAVAYERSSLKTIQGLHASIMWGSIKTYFSPLASANLLNLNYTWLRKIKPNQKFHIDIGAKLNATGWKVDYFPDMKVPYYAKVHSYMVNASLGPVMNFNYAITEVSHLRIQLSAPVFSYADRPKFLDGSPRQIHAGVFNYFNPQIQIEYEHRISGKFSLLIRYQYEYIHYEKPKAIRMLNNGLSIGIKIGFRR